MSLRMLIQDYRKELSGATPDEKEVIKAFITIYEAWFKYKNIFVCGNGGSASNAQHLTCDLMKLGVPAYCLNDNPATNTMFSNDDGWDNVYFSQMCHRFWKGDVLICFSVHGGVGKDKGELWSQNLLKAIKYAKDRQGKVIGVIGFDGGEIGKVADTRILIKSNTTPVVESLQVSVSHEIIELLKQCHPTIECICGTIRNPWEQYCKCGLPDSRYNIGIVGNIEDWKKLI